MILRSGFFLKNEFCCFDAIHDRHLDVRHYYIGLYVVNQLQQFAAVPGLSRQHNILLLGEHQRHPITEYFMIIGNDQADSIVHTS